MKTSKIIELILAVFVVLPIWFYIWYWILSQLNPDRLIWFLFWVYVPTALIATIISKVVEDKEK